MNSATQRREAMAMARCMVVKVGSCILPNEMDFVPQAVNCLAKQLASLHDRSLDLVLVSPGVVSAGRGLMRSLFREVTLKLAERPDRQAVLAIGHSQPMHKYDEAFSRYGKITVQILITRDDLKNNQRFLNARNTIERLLDWRVIPIVNENDTVAVSELEFGDNYTLASLAIDLIQTYLFVDLTSADGIFGANSDQNPGARCLTCIEEIGTLGLARMCSSKTSVGLGSIFSRLHAARPVSRIRYLTARSWRPRFSPGTSLCLNSSSGWPTTPTPRARSGWTRARSRFLPAAARACCPWAVRLVGGCFPKGALVRIADPEGCALGVSLTNYSAADLCQIMGRNTSEIECILGQAPYLGAVQRDNLLWGAAL